MNKFMRTMTAAALMAMVGFVGQSMATELVVVSWGGAYTASQQNAYHAPYTVSYTHLTLPTTPYV